MKIKILLLVGLLLFVASMALWPSEKLRSKPFHTANELAILKKYFRNPIDSGQYFLSAQHCKGCHGFDLEGLANINADGIDVNVYDDWETSMMGLSAIDPLWRAKVSHEITVNPNNAVEAQTLCTGCHAPMGHYTAMFHGQLQYTVDDLVNDSLGINGVGCGSCHAIKDDVALGKVFSGQNIPYDTLHNIYGQFPGPLQGPMQLYVGLTPEYSTHVSEGKFCSPCHTLLTHTLDLSGVPTGGTFVEQATYHEWLNSDYPSLEQPCQRCHMPQLEEAVVIANGYAALPGRAPFNQHQFAGGNSFMVNLIKQNKAQLGVSAADAQFDSTIAATLRLLQNQTLDLTLTNDTVANDTAYFTVKLVNKAGHKFPSGYPSRRAVLQFVVTSEDGDTLFASGMFDSDYRVIDEPDQFAPHRDVITNPLESQIYEMVMADVEGNRTTVLERAATFLKDNRLPPAGFSTSHYTYDTVKIVGIGNDSNFNYESGNEGSGSDRIQYRVALNGFTGKINVSTSVYFQTVPPKWLEEMFELSTDPINTFRAMYNAADKSPVLIANDTLQNIHIWTGTPSTKAFSTVSAYPNPTADGKVYLTIRNNISPTAIEVIDANGKSHVVKYRKPSGGLYEINLPQQAGVYYLRVSTGTQKSSTKLLRL